MVTTPPQAVLDHLRETIGHPAELQERGRRTLGPRSRAPPATRQPHVVSAGADLRAAGPCGDPDRPLGVDGVLDAFAAQAAAALDRQRLRIQAAQAEALAEGNRMRTALLAAVSHDLRTPLASVKASVGSLRQTDVPWSPDDQAELLATIEEGADRLDALIGNLLDMSRIHTGALQPFVRSIALDEVAPLVARGIDGGDRLRFDIPDDLPLLATDPGLLERVLANLVANALRYSPPDRPPTLAASVHDGRSHDRGDRPRTRHRPRATIAGLRTVPAAGRPTFRRRCRPRPRGGQGIRRGDGRAVVGRHDSGRRTDHAGRAGSQRRVTRLGRAAEDASMTSVLVIDDEASILRTLRINLSARDYVVTTASDGTSGLSAMARDRPDVVILDLGLPDMDGTDVIRGIRGWSNAPIIVLSAGEQELQKVQALDAGADDYVTKPFGMNELLARLRAATRRAAPADDEPIVTTERLHHRPRRQASHTRLRRRRPTHPDRVATARGARPPPRPPRHRTSTAPRRLGPGLRHRDALPARLHGAAAPQARGKPRPTHLLLTEPGMGHPARIRVLELLSQGERSVGELLPQVGLEASHLSQQLRVLRRGGLVTARRQGSNVYYALVSDDVAELLAVARRILTGVLSGQIAVLRELQEPARIRRSSRVAR